MNPVIRIKLKSYDHSLVDKSAEKIVKTVKSIGAVISGPIPLPTHKRIFKPLHLRQQEEPRAVPAFELQAPDRHLQRHSQNRRRPDEARAPQRRGSGNQVLSTQTTDTSIKQYIKLTEKCQD